MAHPMLRLHPQALSTRRPPPRVLPARQHAPVRPCLRWRHMGPSHRRAPPSRQASPSSKKSTGDIDILLTGFCCRFSRRLMYVDTSDTKNNVFHYRRPCRCDAPWLPRSRPIPSPSPSPRRCCSSSSPPPPNAGWPAFSTVIQPQPRIFRPAARPRCGGSNVDYQFGSPAVRGLCFWVVVCPALDLHLAGPRTSSSVYVSRSPDSSRSTTRQQLSKRQGVSQPHGPA